ncbi:MAG: hypothetical protein ACD_68C00043G0003 [uncultured bacterium]|nr:MAG: hypothetical protein ACD_68C00043G0003 [uncultured bacterium]
MKKYGFLIILIIVAAIIIGGIWWYASSDSGKMPTVTTTNITNNSATTPEDDTADWKTYTNNKYGYSFEYPANTTVGDSYAIAVVIDSDETSELFYVQTMDPGEDQNNMNEAVKLELKEFVDDIWQTNQEAGKEIGSITETNVFGKTAYTFDLSDSYKDRNGEYTLFDSNGNDNGEHRYVIVDNENVKFIIHYPIDYSKVIDILNSFEFADTTGNTDGYQAATGYTPFSYNGYTFDIPNSWTVGDAEVIGTIGDSEQTEIVFSDANGSEVATLTCPLIITGYERHEISGVKNEDYAKSGNDYNKEISFGTPLETGDKPFALILMRKKGVEDLSDTDSCQIFSQLDWQSDAAVEYDFNKVYESVQ